MGRTTVIPVYQPGDRITERPKLRRGYTREESKAVLAKHSFQRYGTIISNVVKLTGAKRIVYCEVLWDHQKSSSLHSQHRLCPIDKLPELSENYRQALSSDVTLV